MKLPKPKVEYKAFSIKTTPIVNVLITAVTVSHSSPNETVGKQDSFYNYIGVWDTGAQSTVVSHKVIEDLKLKDKHIDIVPISGVNSPGDQGKVYLMRQFILPNNVCFLDLPVISCQLGGEIDILVGMDIITQGDFAITHHNNETLFTFSIPTHYKKIDFVERANTINRRKK